MAKVRQRSERPSARRPGSRTHPRNRRRSNSISTEPRRRSVRAGHRRRAPPPTRRGPHGFSRARPGLTVIPPPMHWSGKGRAPLLRWQPLAGAAQWELVGPTNVGGRMTSVCCAPRKPNIIWAGAAGGGVWKSEDGGQNWRGLWHSQPTLNIGSIAVDPLNPVHRVLRHGRGKSLGRLLSRGRNFPIHRWRRQLADSGACRDDRHPDAHRLPRRRSL